MATVEAGSNLCFLLQSFVHACMLDLLLSNIHFYTESGEGLVTRPTLHAS